MQTTRSARKTIHISIGDIRDHAVGLTGDVRDIGEAVKDVLIEKFTDMLKRAVSFGQQGKEAAEDVARSAREEVEERIQTHPYKAVMIAAGAGLALGLLLHRR